MIEYNSISMMKKIIVTGATSMIGVATIEVAIAHDVEVYAVVRENTNRLFRLPTSERIHIVHCPLECLAKIQEIPNDCDVLYHFAWAGTSKGQRDDPLIQEANIQYTLDAVELAYRCGCKKFVGAGSQAEYGPTEGVIDDSTRFNPVISYGTAKFAAGLLSKKLCQKYGITHIWGRVFSVYGPHDNEGTMLNYAIDQFLKGEKAKFFAATQQWNYLYESDAGYIFYLIGEKVDHDSVYRVANKESRPLRKYIETLSFLMDAEKLCIFANPNDQVKAYGIETCDERLFKDIGFLPQISFEEGIKRTIEKRSSLL